MPKHRYEQQAFDVIDIIINALTYIQKNDKSYSLYCQRTNTEIPYYVVAHIIKATFDDENYNRFYWGNSMLLDSVIRVLTPCLRDNNIRVTYRTGYCNSTLLEEKDINAPIGAPAAYTQIAIFNPNKVGDIILEAFNSVNNKPVPFLSRITRKLHFPIHDFGY